MNAVTLTDAVDEMSTRMMLETKGDEGEDDDDMEIDNVPAWCIY